MPSRCAVLLLGCLVIWPGVAAPAGDMAPDPADLAVLSAAALDPGQFLWKNRLVVVFADTDADPAFAQQMRFMADDPAALSERNVLVVTDTAPAPPSPLRAKLRPHGFSLVWIDKDGAVKLRKASPWTVREITRAIDKTPLRLQEVQDQGG